MLRAAVPIAVLSVLMVGASVVVASPATAACAGTDDESSGTEPVSPKCIRSDAELDAEGILGERINAARQDVGSGSLVGWTDLLVASRWWVEQPSASSESDPDLGGHVGHHSGVGSLATSVELSDGTPTANELAAAVEEALDHWQASSDERAILVAEAWVHLGVGAEVKTIYDGPPGCDPGCVIRYELVLAVTFRDGEGTPQSPWSAYAVDGGRPPNYLSEATTFVDVPREHVFYRDIERLADTGVTRGCNDAQTRFCPDDRVTRGQMAAFLVRALGLPAGSARFDDIPDDHLFARDVAALADAGITRGCNAAGTRYCPSRFVTRAEMAALLVRALDLPAGSATFSDVPVGHTFRSDIAALADAGITRGCNDAQTRFCPDDGVTRGQMAAFLARSGVLDPGSTA